MGVRPGNRQFAARAVDLGFVGTAAVVAVVADALIVVAHERRDTALRGSGRRLRSGTSRSRPDRPDSTDCSSPRASMSCKDRLKRGQVAVNVAENRDRVGQALCSLSVGRWSASVVRKYSIRASKRRAVHRKASARCASSCNRRRVGQPPVDLATAAGKGRADLAHLVADGDHDIERLVREGAQACVCCWRMSMPNWRMVRTAPGWTVVGWLPALNTSSCP